MKKNIAIFDSVSDYYGSAKICRLISEILSEDHNVLKFTRFNYSNSDFKKIRFPLLVNRAFRERPIYFFVNIIKDFLFFLPNFIRIGRKTDLIYCNTFGTIIVGIMYSILLQKKVILHLHESSSGSKFAKSIVSLLAPLFLHVICVSAFTKSEWGLSDCPNVKVIKSKAPDNLGMGLGRLIAHGFYNDEDYYLQIDSHSRFDDNWDEKAINSIKEYQALGFKKPLITQYPKNYWHDGVNIMHDKNNNRSKISFKEIGS